MKRLRVTGLSDAGFIGRGWRFRFGGRHRRMLCGRVGNRRVSIGEGGINTQLPSGSTPL
jgi:hypothetical protein